MKLRLSTIVGVILSSLLFLGVSNFAFSAATPSVISYQGFLTSATGTAQTGTTTVTIRIYDAATGGTLLFEELHPLIGINNGYFSVAIGSVGDVSGGTSASSITDLTFDRSYYVTVELDTPFSTGEMTLAGGTRAQLGTVPFANVAYGALQATSSTGLLTQKGRMYFNTGDNQLYVYDGSAWNALSILSATSTFSTLVVTDTTSLQAASSTSLTVSGPTFLSTLTLTNASSTGGITASTFYGALVGSATLSSATITNLSTSNSLSATGNTLTSNIGGSSGTSTIITSATASSSANLFQVLVNGVSSTVANIINSFTQSVTGNILTSTINGITATTSVISSNDISTSGTVLTTTINGVATSTDLTNLVASSTSNTLTISTSTNSFTLTSTVNGKVATTTATFLNSNDLRSAVNTLTSTVNGLSTSTSIINSSTVAANAGVVTTIINGVTATTSISSLYTFLASSTNSNLTVATTSTGLVTYTLTDTPTFSSSTITTLASTNASTTNLSGSGLSFTSGFITALTTANASTTGISGTGLTFTNGFIASLTSSSLTTGTLTATSSLTSEGALTVLGQSSLANASTSNLSTTNLYATGTLSVTGQTTLTTASATGLTAINLYSSSLTSDSLVSSSATSTNFFTSLLSAVTGTVTNLFFTSATGTDLVISNNVTTSNFTATQGTTTLLSTLGTTTLAVNGGNVGIGTAAPQTNLHIIPNGPGAAFIDRYSSNAFGNEWVTRKARGSTTTPLSVNQNDELGGLEAHGYDGSVFLAGSAIRTLVDGTAATSTLPTRLSFYVNGGMGNILNEVFTIKSSGNIGIGTTTPTSLLSIASSTATGTSRLFSVGASSEILTVLANGNVGIGTTTPGYNAVISGSDAALSIDNNSGSASFIRMNNYGTQRFVLDARSAATSFNSLTAPLAFITSSIERVRIDNSGFVGIGTTTPSSKLFVFGSGTTTPFTVASSTGSTLFTILADGNVGIGTSSPSQMLTVGSNNQFTVSGSGSVNAVSYQIGGSNRLFASGNDTYLQGNSAANTLLANNTGGKVGIGTTTPGAKLDLWGNLNVGTSSLPTLFADTANRTVSVGSTSPSWFNGNGRLWVEGVSYFNGGAIIGSGIRLNWGDSMQSIVGTNSSGLRFLTNDTDRMVITNSGNVGIGTTTPTSLLSIASSTATGTSKLFAVGTSSEVVTILANGNLGIGVPSPSYKVDVAGDIRLNTNATYISSRTTTGVNVRMLGVNASDIAYVGPIDPGIVGTVFNASASSTYAAFYTLGAEKLRIASSGNVGIGTAAPTSLLSVASSTATGTSRLFSVGTTSEIFTVLANGNVGIGSTNPTIKLQVEADANSSQGIFTRNINSGASANSFVSVNSDVGSFTMTANSGAASVLASSSILSSGVGLTGGMHLNTATSAPITFLTFNNERMRIASNGSIGVGTTTPDALLSIASSTATGTSRLMSVGTTSEIFTILANGNVGIGTTTPTSKLSIASGQVLIPTGSQTLPGIGFVNNPNSGVYNSNGTVLISSLGQVSASFDSTGIKFKGMGIQEVTNSLAGGMAFGEIGNITFSSSTQASPLQPADINFSRYTAGVLAVGTGTQGSFGGTLLAGTIGLGTSTPGSRLDVASSTSTSDVDIFRIITDVGTAGNVKFRIDSDGDVFTDGGTTIGTPADLAENYPTSDTTITQGMVVALSTTTTIWSQSLPDGSTKDYEIAEVKKAEKGDTPLGVISTRPGILLGGNTKNGIPVAFSGRVPVLVVGDIQIGDSLTLSTSTPGYAMKQTSNGQSIGRALSSSSPSSTSSLIMMVVENTTRTITLTGQSGLAFLESATSTLPTTTVREELSTLLSSGFSIVKEYVAVTVKGVVGYFDTLFARDIYAETIEAEVICLKDETGKTCINRTDLDSLLLDPRQSTNNQEPAPSPIPEGGEVVLGTSTDSGTDQTGTTTDQTSTTTDSTGEGVASTTPEVSEIPPENTTPPEEAVVTP